MKKDFYFSAKHKQHMLGMSGNFFDGYGRLIHYRPAFINGKEFTEQIDHGKTPATAHFGDLVLVYSGDTPQITYGYDNTEIL